MMTRFGIRLETARKQMSESEDISTNASPQLKYLICAVPRSGSTRLADLLKSSNLAGYSLEYLSGANLYLYSKKLNLSKIYIMIYIKSIMRRRTSSNGVFGCKITYDQIMTLYKGIDDKRFISFMGIFDKIIFINRNNKLEQAISCRIAAHLGQWSSEHAALDLPESERNKLISRSDLVLKILADILSENDAWKKIFTNINVKPHNVIYEDSVSHTDQILKNIFEYLGINNTISDIKTHSIIKRQKNDLNMQIKEAFYKYIGDSPH